MVYTSPLKSTDMVVKAVSPYQSLCKRQKFTLEGLKKGINSLNSKGGWAKQQTQFSTLQLYLLKILSKRNIKQKPIGNF